MVTHPVAGTGAWRGSRTTVALLRGLTLVTITYLAFRFVLVDYVWSPLRWISDVLSLSLGGLAVLALWRDPAWRRAVWACRPGLRNVLLGLAGAIVLAVVTVLASGLANGRGLVDIATGIRSLVLWCTLLAAVGLVAAWELAYGPGQAQGAGRRPWALRVLSWVVALAVFMALVETAGVLLFGWYGPAEWVATLTGSNAGRAVGLMKNPNTLGCFLVLGLLLLWPRWVAAVTRRVRDRAVWAWAVLLLMGLALTYSRQGWLAVAAGLLAAGWVARRLVPWRVTALLMLVVVVVTVLTTILPVPLFAWGDDDGISRTRQLQLRRISETFDEETVDKSRATGRLAMVRYALAMLRDHPVLGVGPGRVGGPGAESRRGTPGPVRVARPCVRGQPVRADRHGARHPRAACVRRDDPHDPCPGVPHGTHRSPARCCVHGGRGGDGELRAGSERVGEPAPGRGLLAVLGGGLGAATPAGTMRRRHAAAPRPRRTGVGKAARIRSAVWGRRQSRR